MDQERNFPVDGEQKPWEMSEPEEEKSPLAPPPSPAESPLGVFAVEAEATETGPVPKEGVNFALKQALFLAPLIILAAFFVFRDSLEGGFVGEEKDRLVTSEHLRNLDRVPLYFSDPAVATALAKTGEYRPTLQVSYFANYKLAKFLGDPATGLADPSEPVDVRAGFAPGPWRAVGLFLHMLTAFTALLLAWVLSSWLGLAGLARGMVAGATGLLFAVHPLAAEPVSSLVSRGEVLLTLFFLGGLFFYLLAKQPVYSGFSRFLLGLVALISFALALMAGSTAVVFLAVLIILEVAIFARQPAGKWGTMGRFLPFALVGGGYYYLREFLTPGFFAPERVFGVGCVDTLWAQTGTWFHYLGCFFYPGGLIGQADIAVATGTGAPWPFGAGLTTSFFLLGGVVLLLIGLSLVRRVPAIGLGLLWFFLAIIPTSTIWALSPAVAENRVYLALFGLAFAGAYGLFLLWRALCGSKWPLGFLLSMVCFLFPLAMVGQQQCLRHLPPGVAVDPAESPAPSLPNK